MLVDLASMPPASSSSRHELRGRDCPIDMMSIEMTVLARLTLVVCTAVAAGEGISHPDAGGHAGLLPGAPSRRFGAALSLGQARHPAALSRGALALRGGAAGYDRLCDSDLSLDHSGASSQDLSRANSASEGVAPRVINGAWPSSDKDGADRFRRQVVKLMVQAMESFGFPESARKLELESGVALYDGPALEALELQKSLLDGDWQTVDEILSTASWVDNRMRYMAYRQLYLELLHADRHQEAADCLDANLEPAARACGRPEARREVPRLKSLLSIPSAGIPATDSLASTRKTLAVRNSAAESSRQQLSLAS